MPMQVLHNSLSWETGGPDSPCQTGHLPNQSGPSNGFLESLSLQGNRSSIRASELTNHLSRPTRLGSWARNRARAGAL